MTRSGNKLWMGCKENPGFLLWESQPSDDLADL